MSSDNAKQRLVILTAIAASLLMLIFGLTHRILLARLAVSVNKIPIEPAAMKRLPLQIGDWTGQDIPLEEALLDATGRNAHISRQYSQNDSLESILLYVGSSISARALISHRPEVCYIGAGFTLMDSRFMELPLKDGTKLPCNVFLFSRGGLVYKKVMVLNYFIIDGQFCGDFSVLRSKVWRGSDTIDYATQILIIASTETLIADSTTTRLVFSFAIDSAKEIAQFFEDITKDPNSG
ncbi:MAG: exosortase-associated EpsI family protein [Planctomycetes bacterium]|nr:exosortase-associated EpsI family protein [Planctomycetota bacterium]